MLSKPLLYLRTLRHLKPVQFYGRLRKYWPSLVRDITDTPPLRNKEISRWQSPACRKASVVGPKEFHFLNDLGNIDEIGWDGPAKDKLWRYNQHYFDDLNAKDADLRSEWHRDLLVDWIRQNPVGEGSGWEPYPVSLRIVNWLKSSFSGQKLSPGMEQSLAIQANYLAQHVEWHLLGNHLFANAKALLFSGLYFDGKDANDWLECALKVLHHEIPEQILPDGGQFELSPMYHALALEDMLDILNILTCYPDMASEQVSLLRNAIEIRVPKMLNWLSAMSHPNDELSFFNDTALGIAPSTAELSAYAKRLGINFFPTRSDIEMLSESGYLSIFKGQAFLIADVGRIGPDYLPGHSHADTLSFELSVAGSKVLVNSGTSVYGEGAERLRQRGTAAHNTVVVESSNSSEVWRSFRVARRASVIGLNVQSSDEEVMIEASHDGYSRLKGKPIHTRIWRLDHNWLHITDSVSPPAKAQARYHVHPDIRVEMTGARRGVLVLPDQRCLNWIAYADNVRIVESSYHPEFGISLNNQCITIDCVDGHALFKLELDVQ